MAAAKNMMPKQSTHGEIARGEKQFGALGPTRVDSVLFFLLLIIPMLSMAAFGAVDMWAFGILAIFAAGILSLWFFDAKGTGSFRFSSDLLQLPLIAMIGLG
ncbi:MAG TPA: hypothetical protein DEA22_06190, partial [Blastocatellia bacterium]|nr:hypothetical protein [Blastocatellia bacterium]